MGCVCGPDKLDSASRGYVGLTNDRRASGFGFVYEKIDEVGSDEHVEIYSDLTSVSAAVAI